MARPSDKFAAEEALYQDAVENIRFAKLQQWRVTNYAVAIYAAAFFLRTTPPLDTCGGKAALTCLLAIVCAFSLFVLSRLQDSISKFRNRIGWFYERHFMPADRRKLVMEPKSFWFDPGIFVGLMVVSVSAAILVLVVIRYAA
jgi:hypothetical protein